MMYADTNINVEGKEIDYELSAGIDLNKTSNFYYMPSLGFYKNKGLNNEKFLKCWDNDEYLLNVLLNKVLKPWVENKQIPEPEEFAEIIKEGVNIEDFPILKQLLEQGVEIGFFKETKITT